MTGSDASRLTLLTTLGVNAVKTFRRNGERVESEGYGRAKRFTHEVLEVDDRGRWLERLRRKRHSFVVLGSPKDWTKGETKRRLSGDRDGEHATLQDVPRLWMPVDVDEIDFTPIAAIDDGDTFALEVLDWLGATGSACVWHLTNSHGFFDKYRIRLWLRLAEPATCEQMREHAKARWAGKADLTVYRPAQPIYTGDPICEGVDDPVTKRVGHVSGEALALTASPRGRGRGKGAPADTNVKALERAGLYIGRLKPGQHMIVCPWEDEHSGEERDDDTFYFEPHHNGHGAASFKCHHASCADKRWEDVLREIGQSVVEGDTRHDWGNAKRLWQHAKDDVRYEPVQRAFYVWDGVRWRADEGYHRVQQLAIDSTKRLVDEAASCANWSEKKLLLEWIRTSHNQGRIHAAVELLKNVIECHVRASDLDPDPFLVGVQNGVVDLRTGELLEPDRALMITKAAGCAFDATARCERWLSFLSEITGDDEEMARYLQALVGYTLSGDTSGQMLLFLYGTGQNGKSVFIEVVRDLLGEYGMSLRTEALSLKALSSKGGPNEDIARLIGARMVTVNETAEGMRFDESLIKDLTGEDTIAARKLYQGTMEFRPAFKIWIRGNHQPEFNGADGGMARRVRLIPFEVRIADEQVDPRLREKLRAELPGILNWAIEGCRAWLRSGTIQTPRKVLEATSEYVESMDGFAEFVESQLVRHKRAWTPITEIFRRYEDWARYQEGVRFPFTKHRLSLRLKGRGFKATVLRVKGRNTRGFSGVRLRTPFSSVMSDGEGMI